MATYGIKDICERFAVGEHTVLGWIHRGQMVAINVSRKCGSRPKWRVTLESLTAFEQLRTPQQPLPRTRRKKQQQRDVIAFYK